MYGLFCFFGLAFHPTLLALAINSPTAGLLVFNVLLDLFIDMMFQVSHYSFWKKKSLEAKKNLGSDHRMIPYHIYVY
jgi:hypothetical protein